MKRPTPLLRLTPEVAGKLQQQCDKASGELAALIRPWSATEARLTFHQRLMDQLAIEHRRKAA